MYVFFSVRQTLAKSEPFKDLKTCNRVMSQNFFQRMWQNILQFFSRRLIWNLKLNLFLMMFNEISVRQKPIICRSKSTKCRKGGRPAIWGSHSLKFYRLYQNVVLFLKDFDVFITEDSKFVHFAVVFWFKNSKPNLEFVWWKRDPNFM